MIKDVPDIFSGSVEVDETYLGGQWKNKRKMIRDNGTKRGRGTNKQPVFGILCRNGTIWAEVFDDIEAGTLQPLISQKESSGSIVCSYTWKAYTGIAARGCVHCLMVKDSTSRQRESHQLTGRILGISEKKIILKKGDSQGKTTSLSWRICLEVQSSIRSRKYKDSENHSTVRKKLGAKLILYPKNNIRRKPGYYRFLKNFVSKISNV